MCRALSPGLITPKNVWMFTPEMGVDVALNQADLLGSLIVEEMSLGDMMTLLKLRKGAVFPGGGKSCANCQSSWNEIERPEFAGSMCDCGRDTGW